ncbi:MAG: glycosyltransferase [Acidobacteria bacterium]|nr:glycosyltransferase [Acidobacteriota bacterium]
MKILRIIARLNVGGPARHVVSLTDALYHDEFESTLIAGSVPSGEEDMSYLADACGIKPIFIFEMSRELSVSDAVSLFKVFKEIRRIRPDIIHTHTAKAGTVGRAAALLHRLLSPFGPRVRIVHTFHGHVFHSYYGRFKTQIFLLIEKILARLATDRIVVISKQQFDEIHNHFGVGRKEQFRVIPLGIDTAPFDEAASQRVPIRRELEAANDEIVVGFVGRLTEIKNLSLYLKAAAMYRSATANNNGPKIKFVIVGDGHCRKQLEDEAARLGLGETVIFLGNRLDIAAVYAGLDVVVLTSLNEGTPLSLIEAMAARKAVISTVVGGVRDLLGAAIVGKSGFRIHERGVGVESGDAAGLINGLIYLAKNEKLRETLGRDGREFIAAIYSKERLVTDIKELYRTLSKE